VIPTRHFCLILHAHLPYVRHPEREEAFEESWLVEAIVETYVPLIGLLRRLETDGVAACPTLSLSPTLVTMLSDPFLHERILVRLDRLAALAERERARVGDDPGIAPLVRLYRRRLDDARRMLDESGPGAVVAAFAGLRQRGRIELITSAATHGFLPLLRAEPRAVQAQLAVAQDFFRQTFGRPAPGVWLPECGYYVGLEEAVAAAGFGYMVLDSHGLAHGAPAPRWGVSAPVVCANGTAAFGRDPESSRQVWSRTEGYPGDVWYRDFYRDIGYDLEEAALAGALPAGGGRGPTGFKYHRITGRGDRKDVYDPGRAAVRVAAHIAHFCAAREGALERAAAARAVEPRTGPLPDPVLVAPFDAELFGHWWFEGPVWLEGVVRRLAADGVAVSSPSAYLAANPVLQRLQPAASSWGEGGYSEYWLNDDTDGLFRDLDGATRRMGDLARRFADHPPGSVRHRALQQAARSLMLAQASDWPFLIRSKTAADYAAGRFRDHLARFRHLDRALCGDTVDPRELAALEFIDDIFPGIDPGLFA
jgi:1,4-alpha-glucan branching enzyme